jgi:hypothetical protein
MTDPRTDDEDEPDPLTTDTWLTNVEAAFEAGECPWCEGEFANVKAHASQAHAEEWDAYKEASE